MLKWARCNGCPWDERTCMGAAMAGRLDILQWARAQGCPWDVSTHNNARCSGYTEIMEWARVNGCPLGPWPRESVALHLGFVRLTFVCLFSAANWLASTLGEIERTKEAVSPLSSVNLLAGVVVNVAVEGILFG